MSLSAALDEKKSSSVNQVTLLSYVYTAIDNICSRLIPLKRLFQRM